MKKKNDSIFILTDSGQIRRESTRSERLDDLNKPDSVFFKSFIVLVILALCFAADFASFYGMISMLSFSSPLMVAAAVIGLLICFDVSPVYLGLNEKRRRQNMGGDKTMSILALLAFLCAAAINTYLRWQMRFMLADITTSFSAFGQTAEASISSDDLLTANTNAILFILLPVATSLVSYFVSYLTYDPIGIMKLKLQKKIADLDDQIIAAQEMLSDYRCNEEYKTSLISQESDYFRAAQETVFNKAVYWLNYAGLEFASIHPNPSKISAFSQCTDVEKEKLRQAIHEAEERVLNTENKEEKTDA